MRKQIICGAWNRQGEPCQAKQLYRNGRCKNHGGLSTGPKTPEGKAKVAQNWKRAKAREALKAAATRGLHGWIHPIGTRAA